MMSGVSHEKAGAGRIVYRKRLNDGFLQFIEAVTCSSRYLNNLRFEI